MEKCAPRSPSPRIYRKLFRSEPQPEPVWAVGMADLRRWLVPVVGSIALTLLTFEPRQGMVDPFEGALQVTAPDQWVHAKFERFFSVHNTLPMQTLEWSFGSPTASAQPALFYFTNSLLTK